MLCENCKENEASIHITDKVGGQYVERHLCADCSGALVNPSPDDLVMMPLAVLKALVLKVKEDFDKKKLQKQCPHCGATWKDFLETGKLGCSYDYELFRMELTPLMKKLHDGKFLHSGKLPTEEEEKQIKIIKIKVLEEEMKEMIKTENYERAAKLRDRIKKIKEE